MGNESLSSAFGWVSIACWIVVYTPQLIENYQLQSGEGLSVAFVLIWLAGDLCNFFGAVMAHLQATVIILAIYYTLCDVVLLGQIYYYRWKHLSLQLAPQPSDADGIFQRENGEQSPLLGPRRHSQTHAGQENSSPKVPEEESRGETEEGLGRAVLRYVLALVFVIGVGLAAWLIASRRGEGGTKQGDGSGEEKDVIEWKSQAIGWMSAVLYLGSRIPQIFKNFKTRCEGLSLAMFLFTIVGNVTYVLSICVESMKPRHLIANASWLAGSGLTVFLDVFVLCQFFYYHKVSGKIQPNRTTE